MYRKTLVIITITMMQKFYSVVKTKLEEETMMIMEVIAAAHRKKKKEKKINQKIMKVRNIKITMIFLIRKI